MPDPNVQSRTIVLEGSKKLLARFGSDGHREMFPEEEVIVVRGKHVAIVLGHGDGELIGKATPEKIAEKMKDKDCLKGGIDTVFLLNCNGGAGPCGRRLCKALGVTVWSCVTKCNVDEEGVLYAKFWEQRRSPKQLEGVWHRDDPK